MSETQNTPQTETTSPAKARKARASHVAFGSIHVRTAKARNVDVTRAAKLNRSYIRSNFDNLVKVWPELAKSGKGNRDGNRYPVTIPAKVADMIVSRHSFAKKRAS